MLTTLLLASNILLPRKADYRICNVYLHSAACSSTTEAGHDEVYAITTVAIPGTGYTKVFVSPDTTGKFGMVGDADGGHAWDFNDDKDDKGQWITEYLGGSGKLCSFELPEGQTAVVTITLMESDSTDWSGLISAVGGKLVTAIVGDTTGSAQKFVDQIIASLGDAFVNKDDYLGSVRLRLKNNNGPDIQGATGPAPSSRVAKQGSDNWTPDDDSWGKNTDKWRHPAHGFLVPGWNTMQGPWGFYAAFYGSGSRYDVRIQSEMKQ